MRQIEPSPILSITPEKLQQLIYNTGINDVARKINDDYVYWDKAKYYTEDPSVTPEEAWFVAQLKRKNNSKRIEWGKYAFSLYSTDKMQEWIHQLDMSIGGSLESRNLIPDEDKHRYLVNSLMEESISSSQIEGAVTTRKVAKDMLRKKRNPRNTSERMIFNNYITIREILKFKNEPLTIEKILQVHKLITKDTLDNIQEEGVLRTNNDIRVVDIMGGEAVYTPPQYNELKELLEYFCRFFNEEDDNKFFIHPIIRACIIHFMIGFIHPFTDGNGRTARALFYWYMLRKGYWLTEYLSISTVINKSKAQYARAFLYTEIDENDLGYFIHYKLKTMLLAYKGLKEYINRKISEKKKINAFIKMDGVNERQALVLKWIEDDKDKIITAKELANTFGTSVETSRTDLKNLHKQGWLHQFNLNKKTPAYTKGDQFDKLIQGAG